MKRLAIATLLLIAVSGCEGSGGTRDIFDPQGEPRTEWYGRATPSSDRPSSSQEIAETGVFRLEVEHRLVRVRYYEVARYRIEETRYYIGPTVLLRSLLFPLYVVLLFPLDFIAGGEIGPFPLAHIIFEMDSEWVPTDRIREVKDISITDWDEGERTEPMAGVSCDLVVTIGLAGADPAAPLRVFHATTGADGICAVDLRGLARDVEAKHTGWTLEYVLNLKTGASIRRSLSLSDEQVTRVANLK